MRTEIRVDKAFIEELKSLKNIEDYKFFYDSEKNEIEVICIPKISLKIKELEIVLPDASSENSNWVY